MDSSTLVLPSHVAKFQIPWLRKLQEGTWLSSIGFGGYSVKNTFVDWPATEEEFRGMKRHQSEPTLPSSFTSTEMGEERQVLSPLSSEVPSSFVSSGSMEGTKSVHEDANEDEEIDGVSQINRTTSWADVVGSDDDLSNVCHSSGPAAATSTEWPQEMRMHSCMPPMTTGGGISQGENECTSERKSSSDSVPGGSNVSKKDSLDITPPLDEMPWDDHVTTVMIRQLPLQCTQAAFMAELTARGFANVFDFLYLPFDQKKGENVGYGFVNFLEARYARACRDSFDGTYLPLQQRRQPLTVHPARLQGYEANYKHFVLTKVGKKHIHPRFSPVFLSGDGSSTSKVSTRTVNPRQSKVSSSQKVQRGQKPQHVFCHMCGTKQLIGFRFCVHCGVDLETPVSNTAQS